MSISRTPIRFYVVIAALVFAGVASVAYAMGAASRGGDVAGAAPTTVPGHPELGAGWVSPQGFGGGTVVRAGGVAITITRISGSQLSLQTTDGWTRTIDVTGVTITRAGKTISIADLKTGDQITFREARQSDGTYKITSITVLVPTVTGTVTSVAATSVTVSQPGGTKTLTLTSTTTYSQGGAAVSISALVAGERIVAQGTVDSSGNFTATAVTIQPSVVIGTVASKTATSIVVTTSAKKSVTVNVSGATKFTIRGVTAATLAGIATGDRIEAQGTLNADGSLTATSVVALPKGQPGFGGMPGMGRSFGPGIRRGAGGSVPPAKPAPSVSGSNV